MPVRCADSDIKNDDDVADKAKVSRWTQRPLDIQAQIDRWTEEVSQVYEIVDGASVVKALFLFDSDSLPIFFAKL